MEIFDFKRAAPERKWFVFVRRLHKGPFTEFEVLEQIAGGQIDAKNIQKLSKSI